MKDDSPRIFSELSPQSQTVLNRVLWPLATVIIFYITIIQSLNRANTDDFTTVYNAISRALAGIDVYSENYHHVNPHYLYNPGTTLLLSPMGMVGHPEIARILFIILNSLAILAAIIWLLRTVGVSRQSPAIPLCLGTAFLTEAVTNTLGFSNINGILLFLLTAFLCCHLQSRRLAAGITIGIAILIKPIFLPLLFIPCAKGHWNTIFSAFLVPLCLNLLAWPLIPGASNYIRVVTPYLGITRNYANASLPGFATYFGMPTVLEKPFYIFFALLTIISVIILLQWRHSDPLLWVLSTSGILMTGVFFLSSLGQMYYSMMLFPFIATFFLNRSIVHYSPIWLGLILIYAPWSWASDFSPTFSRWAPVFVPTLGWGIIIFCTTATVCAWWWKETKQRD